LLAFLNFIKNYLFKIEAKNKILKQHVSKGDFPKFLKNYKKKLS